MKKWILAASFLVLIAAIWFVTREGGAKVAESPLLPQIEKVKRGNLRVEVSATGVIEPINKVEIKSKASGLIEELRIEESDPVRKGALIARLDQRDTKNAYDQAIADLQVAEATVTQRESDFKRKKELFEKGLISAAEFDQAKLALVDAQAQLVRSKINVDNNDIRLKDTVVRSHISGLILSKDVEEGQIISSGISSVTGGTLIATVANMEEVFVKADVDEIDIGKITPGMKAKSVADAYPSRVFAGEVIRIAAQAKLEQNVTTFEVTIMVKNSEGRLKAGMNASVEILVADKKDVLLVPNEALMIEKELQQEISKLRMAMAPAGESERPQARGDNREGRRRPGRQDEQTEDVNAFRRGVIVKRGEDFKIKMVKTGISNFDYTEAIEGVEEGDEIVFTFLSRARMASDQFRQRMTSFSSMRSGLRSSNNQR